MHYLCMDPGTPQAQTSALGSDEKQSQRQLGESVKAVVQSQVQKHSCSNILLTAARAHMGSLQVVGEVCPAIEV